MSSRRSPWSIAASLAMAGALVGCGRAPDASPVASAAAPRAVTTTVMAGADLGGAAAASPVEGLTADQLRAAIEAPPAATARSATGPVADRVTLADGTTRWRVRVPGDFQARSARVEILLDGRSVGQAVLAPDLGSIATVTVDDAGIRAGAPVSYRWEGSEPVLAGSLVVVR